VQDPSLHSALAASYDDLLRLARARLAREQAPISAGTLVHELWLDLQARGELRFASRAAFLAYAGKAMRSLLVDMARERLARKRKAEVLSLTVGDELADAAATPEQTLALSQALERLGALDARLLQVAELRAVMGLPIDEVAELLDCSPATVKRDWQRAKAFLHGVLRA
jgi:RNA polymerase sigma factor (TIGR02999 family)